ncbi:hypothetical protein ACJJIQ_09170 [Microbulbifer sp. ANSA003]|uniref:Uncharacterized protein n=1 Tax=Microbulbifer okhotskensis TaxID=2926617 RepID=A0A9X2EN65_9GAMM|nr:hypothetical protein [Microbulbifer okhotskensis]MCO1335347.1 hypothetical protein [Microbulbifer okhotskensis]
MLATHFEAKTRYGAMRDQARQIAWEALPVRVRGKIELGGVDNKALVAFRTWQHHPNRKVDWDWTFANRYCFRYPKGFDLSVWFGNRLSTLALGRPTYHGTSLRMDFVEKSPDLPMTGFPAFIVVNTAYQAYAQLIGAKTFRIIKPMNEKLVNYYMSYDKSFEYHPAANGNPCYLERQL